MTSVTLIRSMFPDMRTVKEAYSASNMGYEVRLIVWDKWNNDFDLKNRSISVTKWKYPTKKGDLSVVFKWPLWWLFIFKELNRSAPDVVHCADFDTCPPGFFYARLKGIPVIFDVYDYYTDLLPFTDVAGAIRQIFKKVEDWFARTADFLIIADESRYKQMDISPDERTYIVKNSPSDVYEKKPQINDDAFVVYYGGGVDASRCIHTMIEAVMSIDGVRLIVQGSCPKDYAMHLEDVARGNDHIKLDLRFTPHEEIMENLSRSDATFAIYDPKVLNNRYASANKLFEAMCCMKPVIVAKGTSMDRVVEEDECGLVVRHDSVDDFIRALERLKNDVSLSKKMGENGRRAFLEKYQWSLMEKRLMDVYQKALNKHWKGAQ
jgi:glycosyltransferase involved in cell wall biosynthesis